MFFAVMMSERKDGSALEALFQGVSSGGVRPAGNFWQQFVSRHNAQSITW
jgi:hypothetical protein